MEAQSDVEEELHFEECKRIKNDSSDDLSQREMISLEDFYSTTIEKEMSDESILEYMRFAAKLSMFEFKDDQELLSFKSDFKAALQFINKLDEVDVSVCFILFLGSFI